MIFVGLGVSDAHGQLNSCPLSTFNKPCNPGDVFHKVCVAPAGLIDEAGVAVDVSGLEPDPDVPADNSDPLDGVVILTLCASNFNAANIMSRLDIDGDGVSDVSADTDGDGLPDNWELGGLETSDVNGDGRPDDRVVFYPAPSPVVPGTPPTPIFTRRPVATSALSADTDGDGLSDFVEVFGLMFIDDLKDGVLDSREWMEPTAADMGILPNGLPNPGEFPIDQSDMIVDISKGEVLIHDFDGFVFTDPTNPDTDGDGIPDGTDLDPLINPRSFGISDRIIVRFDAQGNADIDKDGLGNGMDMGNDLVPDDGTGVPRVFQEIDNPDNLLQLLDLFREDLLDEGVVPESAIEDLLGADWDGNGLWRTTDVLEWTPVIDLADPDRLPPDDLFIINGLRLYAPQLFSDLKTLFDGPSFNRFGQRGVGLGWQGVLKPPAVSPFMPDRRVWAILYAWRVPGFDIDGDGFTGVPNITATAAGPDGRFASIALHNNAGSGPFLVSDAVLLSSLEKTDQPFDDRIPIGTPEPQAPSLNGVVEVPGLAPLGQALIRLGCGGMSMIMLLFMFAALSAFKMTRRP